MAKKGFQDFEITVKRSKVLEWVLMGFRVFCIAVVWPLCSWGIELTKVQSSQAGEISAIKQTEADRYAVIQTDLAEIKGGLRDLNQKVYDLKGRAGP